MAAREGCRTLDNPYYGSYTTNTTDAEAVRPLVTGRILDHLVQAADLGQPGAQLR